MVGVTKVQRGNADYWLRAVAEGGEDYYTKPGEEPGQWVGGLASYMGLEGKVDGDEYMAILEGSHPTTGTRLLNRPPTKFYMRPDGTERRAEPILAYDVRFSAPKSVSLLYAFGDAETKARVLAILEESVKAGLTHLDREACYIRREEGGRVWIESGKGFIGVAFRHRMSRSGDPALHVHVLVSNLTQSPNDDRWYSLFNPKGASPLFVHAKSAGVVFQAVMRAAFLREMGLEFGEVKNGYADIEGFTPEMIDAFSSRRREVLEWLAERGVSSAEAAQVAAYRTRPDKDFAVDVDRRTVEWIEQGAPLGLTPESVAQLVGAGHRHEPVAITEQAIDAAVGELEEHWSYFDRRHLLWAIANQLPEGASLEQLEGAVQWVIASERIVTVEGVPDEPFTTPRIAAAERDVVEGALAGLDAGVAKVAPGHVAEALARHPYLGADQQAMVTRLLEGGEQVVPVTALPGTGKTTALVPAREAWEAAGHVVIGVAVARTASGVLVDAEVPATTIAALLYRVEEWRSHGKGLPRGTVLLVDEASVASSFDLAALYAVVAECEGKLVPISDPRQIGAVGPGGLFAHLAKAVEPSTLTEIRRQHRPEDRELVALLHEGRGSEALDLLQIRGRLIVGESLSATLDGMLLDWHRDFASGADVVMIARRNREVDWLNEAARQLRVAEGALGRDEVIVGEQPFAVGDRVLTRLNRPGVDNRERWEVTGVDAAARTIRLQRVGGDEREVVLGPQYLDKSTPSGSPSLQHAYAITTFGSQGKTFDRAYPLLDPDAGMEEQLVAMSRGREVANAYMVAASEFADPEIGPARRELSDALHDVRLSMEREGADVAAREIEVRRRVEACGSGQLGERRAQLAEALASRDPDRRERLREGIERNEGTLARLRERRETLEAMAEPPRIELAKAREAEAAAAERLGRRRAELEAGPAEAALTSHTQQAELRLEAALVDAQIERLALAEVAVARLGESELLNPALGPFPEDPERAAAWGSAAYTIASYHLRHGITEAEPTLGQVPLDPVARDEYDLASEQVTTALEALQQPELGQQLDLDLSPTLEL